MIPRLYTNASLASGATTLLTAEQAHYLRNVLRRKEGDGLRLFNGRDGEFEASISELSKKDAIVALGEIRRRPAKSPDLWLLFAPLKRTATDALAQKATELGVCALQPVITERTNSARVNRERMRLIAIEAAEQSDRIDVPDIHEPMKLGAILDGWDAERALIYCDEAGDDEAAEWGGRGGRAAPMLSALEGLAAPNVKAAILIGPEGGFSPPERAKIRANEFATPVTLGPRILRADTAALAAITLWQAACGDFRNR